MIEFILGPHLLVYMAVLVRVWKVHSESDSACRTVITEVPVCGFGLRTTSVSFWPIRGVGGVSPEVNIVRET